MKRMRSAYARRRGLDNDGPDVAYATVGAEEPDLSQFHSPASIDPLLAAECTRRLATFMARGATYGSIEAAVMKGSDNVGRWYAFRYAEHPADAGIATPHPGVDYLVGPLAADGGPGLAQRGGLAAVGVVTVALLLMFAGSKR